MVVLCKDERPISMKSCYVTNSAKLCWWNGTDSKHEFFISRIVSTSWAFSCVVQLRCSTTLEHFLIMKSVRFNFAWTHIYHSDHKFSSALCFRNLETISIGTCRLHGSPKMCASTNASPHHRLHHHHRLHLHRSHSRVQSLDLMDDIPLPFQTDQHHLNILVQDSPMLSPNPPPSVVAEGNGQHLPPPPALILSSNPTLASGQTTSAAHQHSNNILSNNSNFNNTSSTTPTTNVIINNIKTNTTTIGTTNLDSGVVHPSTTSAGVNSKSNQRYQLISSI